LEQVRARSVEHAEQRLIELLAAPADGARPQPASIGPFLVSPQGAVTPPRVPPKDASELRARLRAGELGELMVELEVQDSASPLVSVLGGQGMEEMELRLKEMLGNLPGMHGKRERRKLSVAEARRVLEDEEAQKLLDPEQLKREAVRRAEQS